ncbi:MAG TPA: bifunctional [glutamate--ammonia ligase]-adenylyl-L-tyrosine phosphorylase/[glutamate--ammonia-ligase] adenylyltransferase, partial [Polyangiaceae bacterium]
RRLLALAEHIDPERARALTAELGDEPEMALAILLGTAFPPLTAQAPHQRVAIERLASDGLRAERRRRDLLRDAFAFVTPARESEALFRSLRRFVWMERARIALRELLPVELGGAPVDVTARELSALADVALEVALFEARSHVAARFGMPLRADGEPSRLIALGMGKLGGQELNAGSDVDLIFVYDSDDGQSRLSLHDHWSRVVHRAVATIEEPSADGLVWRVDLRLRPEGALGAVVNSVAATERYYETWGRLWERAALLRARVAAGDAELGQVVLGEIVTPFVYRHAADPGIARALSDLVERSRAELSPDPLRDLKLGPGGIREAEFFVQALQLFWGGQEPALRVPGTLTALSRLRSRGLVSDREARRLGESYLTLRALEHRIQWSMGIQTHLLPADPGAVARLARTFGHADERPLLSELERARGAICEMFASLVPKNHQQRRGQPFATLIGALGEPERAAREAERLLGSAEIGEHLTALARRPDGVLGELTGDRFPDLAPALLEALAACADPEQATRTLRAFFGRFSSFDPYVAALGEDLRALSRFVTVLGASRFVGDALVARPELADIVLFGGGAVSDPNAAVDFELATHREALPSNADAYDEELAFVTATRLAKRRVTVEVAVADLAGSISTREATRLLSALADEILRRATHEAMDRDPTGLAVIALGKLGGREIGYGSDLDVIFIFDPRAAPEADDPTAYFTRRAQRIIRLLSEPSVAGPGYELDTRLRPSGAQGMLVTSLPAFARYHGISLDPPNEQLPSPTSSGAAWERQALLRARVCAGDPELGAKVMAVAEAAAYEGGAPPVQEMHYLRERMERELARERASRHDLKTGRGGLLDIEFAVQWLQMRHGADQALRTPDTLDALEALHNAGHLDRARFDTLREGYRFLRRLEQRIHVVTGASSSILSRDARGMEQLARRMGFRDEPGRSSTAELLTRYEDVTENVREAYLGALGLA